MLENYSRVRLMTDRYGDQGAHAGDRGYIIKVYGDAYEVEFSDENGIDFAQIVAREEELQVTPAEPRISKTLENIVINDTTEVTLPTGLSQRQKLSSLK